MNGFIRLTGLAVVFLAVSMFSGCKADSAEPAGFIKNNEIMTKDDNLPFQRAWYDKTAYWNHYNKVKIAPIDMSYLSEATWWDSLSMAWDRENDTRLIAEYMQAQMKSAFEKKEDNRFTVANSVGPRTVVLEMALVELSPTKAFVNAAGLLVGVTLDHGMVAIEARIRDASSGKVIATFADREQGKTTVVNVDNYSWFGHSEKVIDDWAGQTVAVLNSDFNRLIEDSETMSLDPL